MVTKIILNNIDIQSPNQGMTLVIALENASQKHINDIQLSRTYEDISGEKLRRIRKSNI